MSDRDTTTQESDATTQGAGGPTSAPLPNEPDTTQPESIVPTDDELQDPDIEPS